MNIHEHMDFAFASNKKYAKKVNRSYGNEEKETYFFPEHKELMEKALSKAKSIERGWK